MVGGRFTFGHCPCRHAHLVCCRKEQAAATIAELQREKVNIEVGGISILSANLSQDKHLPAKQAVSL